MNLSLSDHDHEVIGTKTQNANKIRAQFDNHTLVLRCTFGSRFELMKWGI